MFLCLRKTDGSIYKMYKLMKVTAFAFATSLVLVGCSDSSSTESSGDISEVAPEQTQNSEHKVEPATGPKITGDSYSFNAPADWIELEAAEVDQGIDTHVRAQTDTEGFVDNINVSPSAQGEITAEEFESRGVDSLTEAGFEDVMARDRVTVDGTEVGHMSSVVPSDNQPYQVDQFYLQSGGKAYVMTVSTSMDASDTERDALSGSVLASWSWN